MINHKAIRALYANAHNIIEYQNLTVEVFDIEGNPIEIDLDEVNAWVDPEAYKELRKQEYPSIVDQLDTLYHEGYDGWKAQIQTVKNKYPKV